MSQDSVTFVACAACTALRRSDIPTCFCGETDSTPVPPVEGEVTVSREHPW